MLKKSESESWRAWSAPITSIEPSVEAEGSFQVTTSQPMDEETKRVISLGSHRPMICLTGTTGHDGFYVVNLVNTDSVSKIFCQPSADNTLWQTTHGIFREEHDNNNFYIGKHKPPSVGSFGEVFVPGPLVFNCRCSIFGLDQVDTVNQTFQAEFYTELRMRGILEEGDTELGLALMTAYNLSIDQITYLNVSEIVHEKELWFAMDGGMRSDRVSFCIKMKQKIQFNEQMELENFPFDIQDFSIPLTFNNSTHRVILKHNLQYPSLFFHKQFQLSSVYNVVYKDIVPAILSSSDPKESSSGEILYLFQKMLTKCCCVV